MRIAWLMCEQVESLGPLRRKLSRAGVLMRWSYFNHTEVISRLLDTALNDLDSTAGQQIMLIRNYWEAWRQCDAIGISPAENAALFAAGSAAGGAGSDQGAAT